MSSARGWWIGLGALLLAQVVTPALPVAAQEMAHSHAGGDDDDDRPFPEGPLSDTDFTTALHLVLGHLDVGEELAAQGAWNDALPHFAHPAEELYPVIGPELARRGAAPFDKELDALLQRTAPASRPRSWSASSTSRPGSTRRRSRTAGSSPRSSTRTAAASSRRRGGRSKIAR